MTLSALKYAENGACLATLQQGMLHGTGIKTCVDLMGVVRTFSVYPT